VRRPFETQKDITAKLGGKFSACTASIFFPSGTVILLMSTLLSSLELNIDSRVITYSFFFLLFSSVLLWLEKTIFRSVFLFSFFFPPQLFTKERW
jgi:hypothetical protein